MMRCTAALVLALAGTAHTAAAGGSTFKPGKLGAVTGCIAVGDAVELTCGSDLIKVSFHSATTLRIWMATQSASGSQNNFTNPAGPSNAGGSPCKANPGCASTGIVIGADAGIKAAFKDLGTYFEISGGAGDLTLRATKAPALTFSMYSGATLLWKEAAPLSWNTTTTVQSLDAGADPTSTYFFGAGMQDGRFSHKGEKVVVSKSFDWGKSGHGGGSSPFYLTNAGFGSFRNTWAAGTYDMTSASGTALLSHNESRFDAYFFAGDFAQVLDGYSQLTGRPFLVPIYGLGLGDSDCYHNQRHGDSTKVCENPPNSSCARCMDTKCDGLAVLCGFGQVVIAIADKYRELGFPGAWFLPNDGYGCGHL